MLLEVFADHNKQMKTLIDKDEYAGGTLTHFSTTLTHTKYFIKWKFDLPDIEIGKVVYGFIK